MISWFFDNVLFGPTWFRVVVFFLLTLAVVVGLAQIVFPFALDLYLNLYNDVLPL